MLTITNLRVYTPKGSPLRISPDPTLTPDEFNTRLLRLFLARGYMCDEEPQFVPGDDSAEEPGWNVAINEANDWPAREVENLAFSTEAVALAAIAGAISGAKKPAVPEVSAQDSALKAFTAVYTKRGDGDYDFLMAVASDHFLNEEGNQSIAEKMADDLHQSGEEVLLLQFDRLDQVVDVWSPKDNKETNEVTRANLPFDPET